MPRGGVGNLNANGPANPVTPGKSTSPEQHGGLKPPKPAASPERPGSERKGK